MDQQGIYFLQKYKEAQKKLEDLEHENKMLKNRCAVLGEGQLCQFCPYDCENRTKNYRGEK